MCDANDVPHRADPKPYIKDRQDVISFYLRDKHIKLKEPKKLFNLAKNVNPSSSHSFNVFLSQYDA